MERQEIESFLALADELHFGRTAERLGVSQARVSQTIKKLEAHIGAPLFERSSRRVALTPLGRQLNDGLGPAYRQLLDVVAHACDTAKGICGTLDVGFLGSVAGELTPYVMNLFRTRHPGVEVRLREVQFGDPLGPLKSGEVDVLFTRLPVEEPDLTVGPVVVSEPRSIVVPLGHRFARRERVAFEDLADEKVFGVVSSAPAYWWDFHVPPTTPSGRPVRRGQAVATFHELMSLVAAGLGVSPVVASVEKYYARPDVAFVPCPDLPISEAALVWRTAGETNRTRAFVQATEDAVRANGGPAEF
ncbi:MAG: LysR family transcriptional regulator [Streptomycetaceae bacterium]|nr:LysR family transcriptional regulator [Streptomycetaceae bacterium]